MTFKSELNEWAKSSKALNANSNVFYASSFSTPVFREIE